MKSWLIRNQTTWRDANPGRSTARPSPTFGPIACTPMERCVLPALVTILREHPGSTIEDLCAKMGRPYPTVQEWMRRMRFPFKREGKLHRYYASPQEVV